MIHHHDYYDRMFYWCSFYSIFYLILVDFHLLRLCFFVVVSHSLFQLRARNFGPSSIQLLPTDRSFVLLTGTWYSHRSRPPPLCRSIIFQRLNNACVCVLVFSVIQVPHSITMVNLEELKEEINALGSTIKSLKNNASAANKDAITTAVASLLAAKKLYADSNNGIGVDGLPYVDGATTKKGSKNKAKAGDGPTAPSTQEVSKYAVVILNLSFGFRDVGRCYIFAKPLTLVCCFTVGTHKL
jgi:hypothetical protein